MSCGLDINIQIFCNRLCYLRICFHFIYVFQWGNVSAFLQNKDFQNVNLFFRKLNICSSCTAKQIIFINMRNNVLLNKISCFMTDLFAKSVHIFAVTVNRLYRTPQLVCNIFDQDLFHTSLTGNFKSSIYDHIFCYSLLWHFVTSLQSIYTISLYKLFI